MSAREDKTRRGLSRVLAGIDVASEFVGRGCRYLILFVFAIVMYDVTMRYVFNAATVWANEIATYLFGAFAALSGAYVLKYDGHVRMDVLYSRLSRRKRAVLDSCTSAAFFLFMAVVVHLGFQRALAATLRFERSGSTFNSPLWPFLWVIPVGAALLGLQGIATLVRNVRLALFGKESE